MNRLNRYGLITDNLLPILVIIWVLVGYYMLYLQYHDHEDPDSISARTCMQAFSVTMSPWLTWVTFLVRGLRYDSRNFWATTQGSEGGHELNEEFWTRQLDVVIREREVLDKERRMLEWKKRLCEKAKELKGQERALLEREYAI